MSIVYDDIQAVTRLLSEKEKVSFALINSFIRPRVNHRFGFRIWS